ncbi:MAG: 6-carboxytetrahydropterin synthase QueD [Cytophagales bacterium]|jgi:6-pyruvoyltetrahydropterin/6-carboxytetrahydropterin synthase|nr:6-pyruvoyl tetrahydropterin synthase family protein [Bacteroidota bacterium]MBS1982091.1 6-pyruvoyl tetrahydropterin synthase family protein [Bacteroidota bacterium]WHZ06436.1 MAG: 6-carboxytetrahydropterin synthase QueD [Cytophagales bacterium]
MSTVRITKIFSFDMAHALEGYNGLCKNIHGHTYHLRITISGTVRNEKDHPNDGMVMDFGILKKLVKKEILEKFDHSLVLNKSSRLLHTLSIQTNERLITTPFQPSCENLLLHFVSLLKPLLPQGMVLVAARLDETPTSYAEWLLSDQP